jgi:hypothetical protein
MAQPTGAGDQVSWEALMARRLTSSAKYAKIFSFLIQKLTFNFETRRIHLCRTHSVLSLKRPPLRFSLLQHALLNEFPLQVALTPTFPTEAGLSYFVKSSNIENILRTYNLRCESKLP